MTPTSTATSRMLPEAQSQSGSIGSAPPPTSKPGEKLVSNEWVWQLAMNSTSRTRRPFGSSCNICRTGVYAWAAVNAKTVDPARQSVWDNQNSRTRSPRFPATTTFLYQNHSNTLHPVLLRSLASSSRPPEPDAGSSKDRVLSGADPASAMEALAKKISRERFQLKLE